MESRGNAVCVIAYHSHMVRIAANVIVSMPMPCATASLKMVEQGAPGFNPHVTFSAMMTLATQHPAYALAATTADLQDEVHVVPDPLHDDFTKLMEFWYAVLLYSTGQ